MDYSVTNLLQSVRDCSNVGASVQDWPDTRLLRLLNRAVQEYMLPTIYKHRDGHFDTFKDTTLVANVAAYRLPSQATAMSVRAVQLVDSSGNPLGGLLVEDELEQVIGLGAGSQIQQGTPNRYYWRGNQMVLFPTPADASYTLRVYYEARPNDLVLNSTCVQITSFPGGASAGFFRLGFTGTAPAAYVSAAAVDLVQNVPGFDLMLSTTINAVSAGVYIEVAGTLPTGLAVGDWVCAGGTAPVVTGAVPELVLGCMVDYVALKAFASKMDSESFSRVKSLLAEDEKRVEEFFKRRNRGDHPVVGRGALHKFRRGSSLGTW